MIYAAILNMEIVNKLIVYADNLFMFLWPSKLYVTRYAYNLMFTADPQLY